MKYKIDRELRGIARLKIPENIKLFPLMNAVLGLSKCKSDSRVKVTRHKTPGYNGAKLETLVIEPAKSTGELPCMVFFHGGGFMLRASFVHYKIAKMYAEKLHCKVIYPDYRLSPEYPFPTPAEDCFETYRWTLANASALNVSPDKIIIGGDSAGGNLALAAVLMSRDRSVRLPAGLMLIYPVTDRRMETDSMKKYTDTPVWNARLSKMMWQAYLGGKVPEKIEYASPAEAESYGHFPPTYIEAAQYDALHDEAVILADRLQSQGIERELHEVKGACHGYETALNSSLLRSQMDSRIRWLRNIINR